MSPGLAAHLIRFVTEPTSRTYGRSSLPPFARAESGSF
jgi:hypothetical protein